VPATPSTESRSSSTSSSASGAPARPDRPGDPVVVARRRVVAVAAALVLVAIVLTLVAGRGSNGTSDELARLAPPGALLWVAASTEEPDVSRVWTMATRFPVARGVPAALAARLGLRGFEPARDLRPWLGRELGVALLPAPLVLADVADRAAAQSALERLGARAAGRAGEAALFAPSAPAGTLFALTADRLIAGPGDAVRAALARAAGHGAGLDAVPSYRRAAGEAGDGTVSAYASADAVRRMLASPDPLIRTGAGLIEDTGLQAVAADAAPEDGGLRIHGHVLRTGGAPASVASTLLGRVPAGAAAALLLPGGPQLGALADRLGGAALMNGVRSALAQESSLDLDRDILAPLREALLSLQARGDVPVVTLAARTSDPAATRGALARAQAPLATRLTGGVDQAFQTTAGGAFTLPVTPELQPSYAVDGDVLVATTAQPGLDERRVAARGIAQAPALARVLSSGQGSVQALGFLDLRQLLGLGARTGLSTSSGYQAVSADLGPVRTAGAVLEQDTDHPTDTTAELFLEIP
jgi:hypothetical protein